MKRRGTSYDGSKVERRKSQRFAVSIPMEASWCGADQKPMKEEATARQVNRNGGHLEMSTYPEVGTRISLVNLLSAQSAEARVLATPYAREGVSQGIIVELVVPSDSFWGVNLQVKKTTVELRSLEHALLAEGIDLRLLKEFRDAVEYIQMAAQVVQRLREVQLRGGEPEEVLSLLTATRLERTKTLCLGVLGDMDIATINAGAKAEEFYRCIEQIHNKRRETKETNGAALLNPKVKLSHSAVATRTDA
jgi:hypothetical protein